ncbi:MAG: MoxR family ATPase [Woeseiaceae bacterium]
MADSGISVPADVDSTLALLTEADYVVGRDLATVVFLALRMQRPLLLEGEAGVGKTELAKALAGSLGRELIRLQCYEGLDLSSAAYEWNYPRQLLSIRLAEAEGRTSDAGANLYAAENLVERPLLAALRKRDGGPAVLLIDEIDRADEPFEAFLLELLSDYQLSIPEYGTVKAEHPPVVVITSNRTREVHDALRRRCLYHWVDYPTFDAESRILQIKAPELVDDLRRQVLKFVQKVRKSDLFKPPGVAETIDWAHSLSQLGAAALTLNVVNDTLGVLLKYQDDVLKLRGNEAAKILAGIQTAA